MSAKNTQKALNTNVVPQAHTMLAHGTHKKGSSEQLGLIQALKISVSIVVILATALAILSIQPSAQKFGGDTKIMASTISPELKKSRAAPPEQNSPLETISVDAMGNVVAPYQ